MTDTPVNPDPEKPKKDASAPSLKIIIGIFLTSMAVAGVLIFVILSNLLAWEPRNVLTEREATGVRPIEPARAVQDFSLPASTGSELAISDLQGKPVLLYFGYTHCPDVCLLSLNDVQSVRSILGEEADELSYLFISVDGDRDTSEILNRYFTQRNAADYMLGMSGDEVTLAQVGTDYGLFYELLTDEADDSGNYIVNHTANFYLLDAEGRMNTIFAYGTDVDLIAERIQETLSS